jgi:hypothetical protein
MELDDNPHTKLLIEFRKLIFACSFGRTRPFVYKAFNQKTMQIFIGNGAGLNEVREGGSEKRVADVLMIAMNEEWKYNGLKFQYEVSTVDRAGNFDLVFDNIDYRVNIIGGWKVAGVWKVKNVSDCNFPALIIFKSHSTCSCC